ncbi:hypothetical protein H6F51_01515 [Cyanobacteria bacterium FACHB-DQ100]|nr:hypothetical protein [Cyanobacteria bacterium FACHB-DQ100]
MKRQFCTVAILTTLGVLSFASIAKAGLTQNGTSLDGSTVDHTQPSLQSDEPSSSNLDGSNLNGTSLDGSTVDHTQLSLQSDEPSSSNLDGSNLNGTSLDGSTVDRAQSSLQLNNL